jgi:hypothetical protein
MDESALAGVREGQLAELMGAVGLAKIESGVVRVRVAFPTFEDWWEPFTFGVAPAGQYVKGLDDGRREQLKAHCAELLPAPFELTAAAWAARGRP